MKYCAKPFDPDKPTVYFDTSEELTEETEKLGIEEYEIINIDGEYPELFKALDIEASNLHLWEDLLDSAEEHELPKIFYLASYCGYTLDQFIENDEWEDAVNVYEGEMEEVAQDLFDELYLWEIPEKLRNYIDYEAFARDLECDGYTEFEFDDKDYVASEHF